MKKRVNTYLAIAITTYCNYQCFYCKKGGESISKEKETISFDDVKKIIANAYANGIVNFRITGGEPTSVSYFCELIEYIMKFKDTKVRINTNGFRILEYIDVLTKYKEYIDIVFSVDSLSEYICGVHFPKYLSQNVIEITRALRKNKISVRYNIVVTKLNECEVRELVQKAIDELDVNVKLLDLNRFSEYLGYSNEVTGKEAYDLWQELFVPMSNFYDFLCQISTHSQAEWTTSLIGKKHGIPMSCYFRGNNWVQVKDSTRGARYSEFCRKNCLLYKKGECQEGVFSLFLSSNLVLHLSGCKNDSIHYDLNGRDNEQIERAFKSLLKLLNWFYIKTWDILNTSCFYVRTKRRSRALFLTDLSFRLKGENLKGLASVAFIY